MYLKRKVPVGRMHVTECGASSLPPASFLFSFPSPPSSPSPPSALTVGAGLVSVSVCVQPPATSPVTITSLPPPRHTKVTLCSLTRLARVSSELAPTPPPTPPPTPAPMPAPPAGSAHRTARFSSMASVRRLNLVGSSEEAKSANREPLPLYTWKYGSFTTPNLRHNTLHSSKSILTNSTSCSCPASLVSRGYSLLHELHHLA
mmetsp:Transcript_21633/g.53457  ORF Transcript_21633/g.53457 Transcript_21633/m.53457 type:complete len:203 (-) Transcript_21633:531-1139(-)